MVSHCSYSLEVQSPSVQSMSGSSLLRFLSMTRIEGHLRWAFSMSLCKIFLLGFFTSLSQETFYNFLNSPIESAQLPNAVR